MILLICNAGSTSLKFKLYEMPQEKVLAAGGVERVGSEDDAIYKYENAARGIYRYEEKQSVPDYETGIHRFLADLTDTERGAIGSAAKIDRVGFKTVLSRGYYGTHELTEPVLQNAGYVCRGTGTQRTVSCCDRCPSYRTSECNVRRCI